MPAGQPGVRVDRAVYRQMGREYRLNISPLTCNCMVLPDGTISQLTDVGFHLEYLAGSLSWDNIKLLKYAGQLGTPFSISLEQGTPTLFCNRQAVCPVSFLPKSDFYKQKTAAGLPFIGNAVLQGADWVAFQCLWPCQYAAAGKPCQFCFSGAEFEALAAKGKPCPDAVRPGDVADIIAYALAHDGVNSAQLTGGSTFSGKAEAGHLIAYLEAIKQRTGRMPGELLLYITPPEDPALIDTYFSLGATRIACSLEVWDEQRASVITPGKMQFTTRARHLSVLQAIAEKHGPGKAFSNLIIGLEPFETLKEGATWLAERGILPSVSVWMPMGRPVMGSMRAPEVDFFRRVKELFGQLYTKYNLEPAGGRGLNVCIERDIWRWAKGIESHQP
nr:hypothetical protein [bacterium]